MKHFLVVAVFVLAPTISNSEEIKRGEASKKSRNSALYITTEWVDPNNERNICTHKPQGSGFIIGQDGSLLSAVHNFSKPEDPETGDDLCVGFDKMVVKAKIGYTGATDEFILEPIYIPDDRSDVALLSLPETSEKYTPLSICNSTDPSQNRDYYASGFPRRQDLVTVRAEYQNRGGPQRRWVFSSDFTHGMSGGPVFDSMNGRVVGLVQGGMKNSPAVRWVVPLAHGKNTIDRAGLPLEMCSEVMPCPEGSDCDEPEQKDADCWGSEWGFKCPRTVSNDWEIYLSLADIKFSKNTAQAKFLEIRRNSSDRPILVLNQIPYVAFSEPTSIFVEVRGLNVEDAPDNLGLIEFDSFVKLTTKSKMSIIKDTYSTLLEGYGVTQGRYKYSNGTGKPQASGIYTSIARDLSGANYSNVVTRIPKLKTQIEPGDLLLIFFEVEYDLANDSYFEIDETEKWGKRTPFEMLTSLISIDYEESSHKAEKRTVQSYVVARDGTQNDDDFEVASEVTEQGILSLHQGLPPSTGVRLEYFWKPK